MATIKIYLYPVWIRIWHIINALMFLLLIFTGISLHFSSSGFNLINFQAAVAIHNVTAIIVTFNYGVFLIGNIVTKNGKFYRKWRKNLAVNLWKQFIFYAVGIFKKEEHPFPINEQQKFNPLQKLTYVVTMYIFLPLVFTTGRGSTYKRAQSRGH